MLPLPELEKLLWPGLALANAISSLTLFTGSSGCISSNTGLMPNTPTGAKALSGSNCILIPAAAFVANELEVNISVWPLGADFATKSAPMAPLAPARFSTMTF